MITLNSTTKRFLFAKSKVIYNASTNAYVSQSAVAGGGSISLESNPVADDTLTISYGNILLVFTFKNTPDNSGLQLPLNTSANRKAYAAEQIVPALKANRVLFYEFDIVADDSTANSVAKFDFTHRVSQASDLLITTTVTTYTFSAVAGQNQVFAPNFSLLVDVWKEETFTNFDFSHHVTLELKPNSNSEFEFDLAPFLQSLFPTPLLPSTSLNQVTRLTDTVFKRIMVKLTESFGSPATVQKTLVDSNASESAPATVLNGGYNASDWVSNQFESDYYTDVQTRRFLTKNPNRASIVLANTPSFLVFINRAANTTITLYARIVYTDGTYTTETIHSLTISAFAELGEDFYLIPCGINALALTNYAPAKVIDYYEIYLDDDQQESSEKFTFIRLDEFNRQTTTFLFQNSFGMPEVVAFYGDVSRGASFKRNEFSMAPLYDYTNSDSESATFNHRSSEKFMVNSGYKDKEFIQYLQRELFMSEEVYLIEGSTYKKVVISNPTIKNKSEDDPLWSIDLEFSLSLQNQSA